MKKLLLLLVAVLMLRGCTAPQSAQHILKSEGYENVQMEGYDWFACSKDDFFHTGFKAEKNGNEIRGTVCKGLLFRGSTIRLKD